MALRLTAWLLGEWAARAEGEIGGIRVALI
jgi:hypothetical protein